MNVLFQRDGTGPDIARCGDVAAGFDPVSFQGDVFLCLDGDGPWRYNTPALVRRLDELIRPVIEEPSHINAVLYGELPE